MNPNNIVMSKSYLSTLLKVLAGLWLITLSINIVIADGNSVSNPPVDDDFGRLFTAQYERNAIDKARLSGGFVPVKIMGVDDNSLASANNFPSAEPIKVLGILLRADGKNKVWLSGVPDVSKNISNGRSIIGNINQSANIKVGIDSGAILKPGQVWSPITGRQESYQIPAPKPAANASGAPVAEQKRSGDVASSSSTSTSSASISEAQSSVSSSAK